VNTCSQYFAPSPPPAQMPRMSRVPPTVTAITTQMGRFGTCPSPRRAARRTQAEAARAGPLDRRQDLQLNGGVGHLTSLPYSSDPLSDFLPTRSPPASIATGPRSSSGSHCPGTRVSWKGFSAPTWLCPNDQRTRSEEQQPQGGDVSWCSYPHRCQRVAYGMGRGIGARRSCVPETA
jgi:hypothetical protein